MSQQFVKALTYSSPRSISTSAGHLHAHADCIEITVVHKGSGTYEIAGQPHTILGNNVLIIPRGVEHSSEGNRRYIGAFYYLKLYVDGDDEVLGLSRERSQHLRRNLLEIPKGVYAISSQPLDLIRAAYEAQEQQNEPYAQAMLAAFLYSIVNLVALHDKQPQSGFTEQMEMYVREHIKETIAVSGMAKEMGYSESYFKTKFRKEIGMTPNDYINHMKITEAKRMLTEGGRVIDTAMALGFNSSNYFAYVFRNYTAMSPTEFIKRNKKG